MELPAPFGWAGSRCEDLAIISGPPGAVPDRTPPGRQVCRADIGGHPLYTGVTGADGSAVLRYHGVCDLLVTPDRHRIDVHADPAADPRLVTLITGGGGIAFVATLQGRCVLHASAVEVGGEAIVVVGPSATGKSTLAAQLCRAGARMVSDDVVVTEMSETSATVHRGGDELRLRPTSEGLADPAWAWRRTVDGRLAVRPPLTRHLALPLAAIVFPSMLATGEPSRRLRVTALGAAETLVGLLGGSRVAGWTDPDILTRQLGQWACLARRVRGVRVGLPAGTALDPGIGAELLDALPFLDRTA